MKKKTWTILALALLPISIISISFNIFNVEIKELIIGDKYNTVNYFSTSATVDGNRFHAFGITPHLEVKNALIKYPDGSEAYINHIELNQTIFVGICNEDYSNCGIFDNYKYDGKQPVCVTFESDWGREIGIKYAKTVC